jgi:DNA-binding phage protein
MAKHDLPTHQDLAANIRRLVREQKRTLTQLPFDAQLSPAHFWKVMRRDAEPRLSWMAKIADALDVPVHVLLMPVTEESADEDDAGEA